MADEDSTNDYLDDQTAQKGKDKAGKAAKKGIDKIKNARKKGKYAKGFGKIIAPIITGIVILIMVIGFISFAINMPGTVVEKVMQTIDDVTIGLKKWWTEEDLSSIKEEDLLKAKEEILSYLDNMGYDVVGMGFVQKFQRNEDTIWFEENLTKSDANDNKEVIQPSYLFSYWLANERIYLSKHANFFSALFKNTGVNLTWGEGMLNIYGDNSISDKVEIDRENLTMTFKNANGFLKTDVYQYNIDGWAGRYGTPLELLLAIHSSTMMPDLVYEFASNEYLQTIVNIKLQEVELKVRLKLIGPDNVEKSVNITDGVDTIVPIEIKFDEEINQYVITNIEQIKEGMENGTYTVVSLYKAFQKFDSSLYDFVTSDVNQNKITEIINMTEPYYYATAGTEGSAVLFGGTYLGPEVNSGDTLYDGAIYINTITNNTIVYTEKENNNINRTTSFSKSAALTNIGNLLGDDKEIIDGSASEKFSTSWGEDVKNNYRSIFNGIDSYFENLLINEIVLESEMIYRDDNKYFTRFENWVNTIIAHHPLNFTEFVEDQGLQSANQYEKEGKYKNYLKGWSEEYSEPLNKILEDIDSDIQVQKDTAEIANNLKDSLAKELGLTAEQVDSIYQQFVGSEPEIKTFVPQIKSVVKHWYKDLIFQYKNVAEGTVFEAPYVGEGLEGYELYYEFETKDENYPVQDGEPYVIKGDNVSRNGKQAEIADLDEGTINEALEILNKEDEDDEEKYTLGTGYKTSRKLFTQGYYYQYDGSIIKAEEIANAKRIESYDEGEIIRVVVQDGRITKVDKPNGVTQASNEPIDIDYLKGDQEVENSNEADTIKKIYHIAAPKKYVSPVKAESSNETIESVESINNTLKLVGSDLRRVKVNMANSATSLTTLAMLKGMHSLDADYIYREFKEFLIELGYYSRAEIESVETNVLEWFMPSFTPEQWPPIKDDEEILEYGTVIKSSSNITEKQEASVDKIANLDNFIFFTDTTGIYDNATLSNEGSNVKFYNTVDAESIVTQIINNKPTAICLYVDANAKNDENAIANTKKLLEDIRIKLKEREYSTPNLPIYILQVFPLYEPEMFGETASENVEKNNNISNYNTKLYSICLNQYNIKFVDATSGCLTKRGWREVKFEPAKVSENIISKIVKKNVSNGGFEEGVTVITPGAGYVTAISGNEITIEFSIEQDSDLRAIDRFTLVISGILVDEELRNKFSSEAVADEEGNVKLAIEKGSVIGVTTTENIKLILRDRNKAIIGNIEDYMGLTKKYNIPIETEQTIQVVWEFEGTSGGDESGYYTVVNPDNGDSLTVGHGITNAVSATFEELGYGQYVPFSAGDRIPSEVVDMVSCKVIESKMNTFREMAEKDGIILLDQEVAALTIFSYQNPAGANQAYQFIAEGKYKELKDYWLNANSTTVTKNKESVEYGITLRRCVEYNIFETGNMEFSDQRKKECYSEYREFIKD